MVFVVDLGDPGSALCAVALHSHCTFSILPPLAMFTQLSPQIRRGPPGEIVRLRGFFFSPKTNQKSDVFRSERGTWVPQLQTKGDPELLYHGSLIKFSGETFTTVFSQTLRCKAMFFPLFFSDSCCLRHPTPIRYVLRIYIQAGRDNNKGFIFACSSDRLK